MTNSDEVGTNLRYNGNIFIAGLSASGKTTHSYMLAGMFGLTYISGSQTHLIINGLSPVQDRSFWVSDVAKTLLTSAQFRLVEQELSRIEKIMTGCVFDSWIMPWRKASPGLSVYLMSTFESRLRKAAVSRRENGFLIDDAFAEAVRQKDTAAIELYRILYGIDIEKDLSVFDLIVDISDFITAPTFEAARASILAVHAIVEAAVGFYLTGASNFRYELEKHRGQRYLLRNKLL